METGTTSYCHGLGHLLSNAQAWLARKRGLGAGLCHGLNQPDLSLHDAQEQREQIFVLKMGRTEMNQTWALPSTLLSKILVAVWTTELML